MAILDPAADETFQGLRPSDLVRAVDEIRASTNRLLNPKRRSELGQFMTPAPVARLMASMIGPVPREVRLLDAGAGVGSLTAAAVAELLSRDSAPRRILATAFEIDPVMVPGLEETFALCERACAALGVEFRGEVRMEDFLGHSVERSGSSLFPSGDRPVYDLAIQNPPYKKMNSASKARTQARSLGLETTNLYSAFVAATLQLLKAGGQLVAITPRSFCNGPYFKPFRDLLLDRTALDRIHVFESRQEAFKDDDVLQETVIVSAYLGASLDRVKVSTSVDGESPVSLRSAPLSEVVSPSDPGRFIHIRTDDAAEKTASTMASLPSDLGSLGLKVSTGRVVDFRAKEHLRDAPGEDTAPLIYPGNLRCGAVEWPTETRKPRAIARNAETESLLVAAGYYVLAKRFSSKEEKRRVVAAVFSPASTGADDVGFENHLNYFHQGGRPLDEELASGLAAFLNSTLVDDYFRQFNGHTQVNATDLRSLRYPAASTLRSIGRAVGGAMPAQADLDRLVDGAL